MKKFSQSIRFAVLLGLLVLAFAYRASAQSPSDDCSGPRALLEKFLQLDGDVGRVSSEAFKSTFDALFTKEMEEPGWDTFTVIKNYQIVGCEKDKDGFKFSVKYETLGEITWVARDGQCPLFTPKEKAENLKAHVTKQAGQWKIDETPGNPHLKAKRAEAVVAGSRKECRKEISEANHLIRSFHNP
jgi:hypothetical protein